MTYAKASMRSRSLVWFAAAALLLGCSSSGPGDDPSAQPASGEGGSSGGGGSSSSSSGGSTSSSSGGSTSSGGEAGAPATRCASPPCDDGELCEVAGDCASGVCVGTACVPGSAADGVKNGTETDVDCGGGAPTNAPKCASGKACGVLADCDNVLCTGSVCQPPTGSDGLKNGTESDVDCGGGAPTNALRCINDKVCATHDDCGSGACAIGGPKAGTCVPFKSCVQNNGGFTCGRDDRDFGGVTNALTSCCETATLAGLTPKINRFAITAGRMRAFIDRLSGNVRNYVQTPATKPAGWSSAWDNLVPSTLAEAEIMLGPSWSGAPNDPNTTTEAPHSKRSCGYGNYNGHSYWVSANQASQIYPQAQLDTKILNCVGWHLVRAFCAWDGGHLATIAELQSAFRNGGTTTYPWDFAGGAYAGPYDSNSYSDDRLNHRYVWGSLVNSAPANNRITYYLSPPGRFYKGWNANGVEIAGNVLEWASDAEYRFAWNLSFENHTGTMNSGGDWRTPNDRSDVPNGYYALGARCAYP